MGENGKQRILMVSDFFYPNFGGVENHIYYLSQCLIKLGHKVVVMTHGYNDRTGVRCMTGGLKVYYVPWKTFLMQNTLPTFYGTLPIMRTILIREKISVVHGHHAFSTLCHEAVMHARTMGYKVVFTDHSLSEQGTTIYTSRRKRSHLCFTYEQGKYSFEIWVATCKGFCYSKCCGYNYVQTCSTMTQQ